MIETFRQRERRDGIVLKTDFLPGADRRHGRPVSTLRAAVTPKTKLILVCHITNRTGRSSP